MGDVDIRIEGRAGRITLTRPEALNALSHEMCLAMDAALSDWARDDSVALVLIDAEGERAFCAGGDIATIYATGRAGDYAPARQFWRNEYRMNARIADYPKPVVSFLQGFVMGGGVGVGCHASHRIVGATSQIAMPECGIGLVPDVGGTLLLSRADGFGVYLALTGARIGPGDAIRAGFADLFLVEADWDIAKAQLIDSGDISRLTGTPAPEPTLAREVNTLADALAEPTVDAIMKALVADESAFAQKMLTTLRRNSPLSLACTLALLRALTPDSSVREALAGEYRFTHRALAQADFLEGIRAAIIDKDKSPRWQHEGIDTVSQAEIAAMLAPLGADELTFDGLEEEST